MIQNPYPDGPPAPIVAFRYVGALWLVRGMAAVRARSGEDADYIVGQPYQVCYRRQGEGWRSITVPAGLSTDLASVPRLTRPLIDRVGPHLEAAVVHDYLYVGWQDIPGRGPRAADKRFADDLFLAGMTAAGVSPLKRHVIHQAVRLFGWPAYRDDNPARYAPVPEPEAAQAIP